MVKRMSQKKFTEKEMKQLHQNPYVKKRKITLEKNGEENESKEVY